MIFKLLSKNKTIAKGIDDFNWGYLVFQFCALMFATMVCLVIKHDPESSYNYSPYIALLTIFCIWFFIATITFIYF